jgi:broad specificity phosphatase PhoE
MAEKVNYVLNPYGGETFPQLMARAKKILARVRREHKSGNVLLVAHGDIGKMIFGAYYGLGWKKVIRLFYFDNSDALLLSPQLNYRQAYIKK